MNNKLLRARAFIKRGQIKIHYINAEKPLIIFKINLEDQEITITKNHKGWLCDYVETDETYERRKLEATKRGFKTGEKWGCVLNPGTECVHIYACKILINCPSLREDSHTNNSMQMFGSTNVANPENNNDLVEIRGLLNPKVQR